MPWHFLYFIGLPVLGLIFPQGQGSLRPIFLPVGSFSTTAGLAGRAAILPAGAKATL